MASKNTPTAIVSGAYWAASFFEKISAGLQARGWDNERIHSLVTAQEQDVLDQGIDAFVDALVSSVLEYPNWVKEHLTPELETKTTRDPGTVELWLDSRQRAGYPYSTGHEVYDEIKSEGLLNRALSYGELKFYEQNPDKIPTEFKFKGAKICGWATVVRGVDGRLGVPCLNTNFLCIEWRWLEGGWHDHYVAAVRASA